jgi:hypothetical protein
MESIQGFCEAGFVEWLQEIVQSPHFKCPDRILVECRDEDNSGKEFIRETAKYFEAVSAGDLYVEKYQVRSLCANSGNGLFAVRAFSYDLKIWVLLQEGPDLLPGVQFVVND